MKYTIAEIKNVVSPLAEQYGAERVFLFGSYARGDANDNSDIDLRIDKGRIYGLIELAGLHLDLEDSFGIKVDLLTTGCLDDKFLNRIAKEEILLYEAART